MTTPVMRLTMMKKKKTTFVLMTLTMTTKMTPR
jgi:hypothetical protein